jgi:hypothetical protein
MRAQTWLLSRFFARAYRSIAAGSSSVGTVVKRTSRASVGRADDGERRCLAMRTAFDAAGNVNVERSAEMRCGHLCDARGDGAGGDIRRRTDRRSGAGDDVPPRIVGADDEAEIFGCGGERASRLLREADHQERSSRRRAYA